MAIRNIVLIDEEKCNGCGDCVTSCAEGAIKIIDGVSYFANTNEPTVGSSRPCGHCRKHPTPEGHDDCLGTLPGVMNACCGHGEVGDAYVQFPGGDSIHGEEAIRKIDELNQPGKAHVAAGAMEGSPGQYRRNEMNDLQEYVGTYVVTKEELPSDRRGERIFAGTRLFVLEMAGDSHFNLNWPAGNRAANQVHFSKLMTA